MNAMKQVLEELLDSTPGSQPVYFEASGWFDDESSTSVAEAMDELGKHYERRLATLLQLLGPPAKTETASRDEISSWYPEAIRAVCWAIEGKTVCIAMEQHDRETPVAVVLRCLTDSEISELSE
ncbi:MAG: hypothetical protein U0939_23540 [Pirellulales bacterium]